MHRADVEGAGGGTVTPVPAAFAQDGLGELVGTFATEPGFATSRPGTLLLHPDDGPAWRVRFGAGANRTSTGADLERVGADAVVRGSSSELYLWAWNRPSAATVHGDASVAALWRGVRIT